jgi:hypothetical protein
LAGFGINRQILPAKKFDFSEIFRNLPEIMSLLINEPEPSPVTVQDDEENKLKRCKKCGGIKILKEFHRQPMCRDGHKNTCIECDSQYNKARYLRQKTDIIAKVKKWQDLNADKLSGYKTKWRLKNIPPIKTRFSLNGAEKTQIPENTKNIENTEMVAA